MVTIEVDEEVWRHLQVRKNPGDSFNDVARRELGIGDESRDGADPEPKPAADVAAAIDAWVPDGDVATQTAREALRDAVAFLDAHAGRATKSDIVDAAKPADVSAQQWWDRGAQPGLAMLADEGLVDRPTTKTYAMEG